MHFLKITALYSSLALAAASPTLRQRDFQNVVACGAVLAVDSDDAPLVSDCNAAKEAMADRTWQSSDTTEQTEDFGSCSIRWVPIEDFVDGPVLAAGVDAIIAQCTTGVYAEYVQNWSAGDVSYLDSAGWHSPGTLKLVKI